MTGPPTYAEIKQEFDLSLGYIRGDIRAIRSGEATLNYTVALLVGCACEMLAGCRDTKNRQGEVVFAEMLPEGDGQILAPRIYGAVRDGLAHGFDTEHILVDGVEHQIYIAWTANKIVEMRRHSDGPALYIGNGPMAEAICAKITEFEKILEHDVGAQQRFMKARQPAAWLSAE